MRALVKAVVAVTVLGIAVSLMSGCASSKLVDIWQDPSFKDPSLAGILVIAVRKDAAERRSWEDAFTNGLVKHGVVATSSYMLYPDTLLDTDQVITAVQTSHANGILVIHRLPMDTNTHNTEGYTSTTDRDTCYSPCYWQRYRDFCRDAEYPGYIDTVTVAIHAIDITTTGDGGRMIWSATSRTSNPGSVADAKRGIVSLAMSELTQKGIISPRKQ